MHWTIQPLFFTGGYVLLNGCRVGFYKFKRGTADVWLEWDIPTPEACEVAIVIARIREWVAAL